jgi:tetratricopeptide (TPR) repeat protein
MDIPFARAIDTNKVARLKDLNSGFASSATINYAYYQASLVVEHIFDTYGQRKLRAFIAAYADGSDTEQALQKSLGIGLDELQKQFDAMLDKRYGKLRAALKVPEGLDPDAPLDKVKSIASAHPESFAAQMTLGDKFAEANQPDAAIAAYEKANELVPNVRGEDSPLASISAVALKKGDKARAARALEDLIAYDHTAVVAARQLVTLLDPKDAAHMQAALKRVVSVDPFDGQAHSALGRVAFNNGDNAEAIKLYRVALAAKPLDKAGAHADLAEALLKAGQKDEAKKEVLEALLIAPTFTRAQDLLLKLQEGSR